MLTRKIQVLLRPCKQRSIFTQSPQRMFSLSAIKLKLLKFWKKRLQALKSKTHMILQILLLFTQSLNNKLMKTKIENGVLRISRNRRYDKLFKMTKDGLHIVYCVDYGDGEKGYSRFIFTNLGKTLEEKKQMIKDELIYEKDFKFTDAVIDWFCKL